MSGAFGRRASLPLVLGPLTLALAGCGGGLPLLHPAQVLSAGSVRAVGGFSANIATGPLSAALRAAQSEGAPPGGAPPDTTFAQGALVAASVGPGLAPVLGVRVGLGDGFEGGLAYTGRAVRADARRAFELNAHWAISLGVAGSVAFGGSGAGVALPNVDLAPLRGWGGDVPVLLGYESDGQLYGVWLGARAGANHVDVGAWTDPVLSATETWAAALLGLAVGFRHVHVALELDAGFVNVNGSYGALQASVHGVTLAPAAALWWEY